ncbi:MAG: hypothetical protein QXT15_02385 [Desulfurococcaceae archaeon]
MPGDHVLSALKRCSDLLVEVRKCVKVLPGARLSFRDATCEEELDGFRECAVLSFITVEAIERAKFAVKELSNLLGEVIPGIGGRGWLLPRETGDFSKDPLEHLKKKILLYTYDLLRRKLSLEDYASKVRSAVNSSMRSNMRTVYEVWVLASILKHFIKYSARIVYPEHGFVHFDRHGKQKTGIMPPNLVVEVPGKGMLSFYLEAPRPLGWRDFKDLKQVWKFYTSLRPDIMIYSGLVLDIVDTSSSDIPVLRPEVIVECKELEDWFIRTRELKGPVNPTLTFDEWFKRWLSGLWTGLADVLGVDSSVVKEIVEGRRRGGRVAETQLVKFYKSIYKPKHFYLVSSPRLPEYIKSELEMDGVTVFDNARIGCVDCLGDLAEEVLKHTRPVNTSNVITELSELKRALMQKGLFVDDTSLTRLVFKFALKRAEEFINFVKVAET